LDISCIECLRCGGRVAAPTASIRCPGAGHFQLRLGGGEDIEGEGTKVGYGEEGEEETKPPTDSQQVMLRRFHGTVELDPTRMSRDAGRISDKILTHLASLIGAKAKVLLEIDIEVLNGVPEDKVRIINENCNTLKFKGHGFDQE
jgi:hypothetical protein